MELKSKYGILALFRPFRHLISAKKICRGLHKPGMIFRHNVHVLNPLSSLGHFETTFNYV